jgi:hypothetical protein
MLLRVCFYKEANIMMMYDLCERCFCEIAWDPDFADYTTGYTVTTSLIEQNGVFIKSENHFEAWRDDCIKTHAVYDAENKSYLAL